MSKLVEVKDLKVHFGVRQSLMKELFTKEKKKVKAVDGINFSIDRGEIVSLVGESGSGKTTTGKAILQLIEEQEGDILFDGKDDFKKNKKQLKAFRQQAQMIFQDPYQSLNPKYMIYDIVAEPLVVNGLVKPEKERKAKVVEALEWAGLRPAEEYLYRYPHELSGGQKQRVAIASALILNPKFIVADEPVSMLDVSVRADILKLMVKLRDEMDLSYLFITHDLSLAWLISDRIAIMYLGKIVEIGDAESVVKSPSHPYSQALINVMPSLRSKRSERKILKGELPDASDMPKGCRFHPRCPIAEEKCKHEIPPLKEVADGQYAACHFAEKKEETDDKAAVGSHS
ncbi:ABC transporter ATP-binding protein [Thalassobacillus hwangdonensis]|uniref:ABC transporter ATP-binding protein n=1 Tax=Thalassobacillus hwangdonensis TaxID=546108 RepID=A0ABW3L4C2_9BACI